MTDRIDELQRLHDGWAMDGDAEGWHCKGCGKLHTRCRCPDMVFEALPALLRVARAAREAAGTIDDKFPRPEWAELLAAVAELDKP